MKNYQTCRYKTKISQNGKKSQVKCKRDGTIRNAETCQKCPFYKPSLWTKIKNVLFG